VADMAICVGAGLLIIDMFFTKEEPKKDVVES
jgi:lipoprotein signal peptidase